MSYELPPHEQVKMRRAENVIMVVFGTLIVVTVVAVLFSKFRPLSQPSNLPRVERPANAVPPLPPTRP